MRARSIDQVRVKHRWSRFDAARGLTPDALKIRQRRGRTQAISFAISKNWLKMRAG
jgi:hypothetical protein